MVGGGSVHFLALPSAPEVARADNERDFHAKIVNGFDFFDDRRNYVLVEPCPCLPASASPESFISTLLYLGDIRISP